MDKETESDVYSADNKYINIPLRLEINDIIKEGYY